MNLEQKGLIALADNFRKTLLVSYLEMLKDNPLAIDEVTKQFSTDIANILADLKNNQDSPELQIKIKEILGSIKNDKNEVVL